MYGRAAEDGAAEGGGVAMAVITTTKLHTHLTGQDIAHLMYYSTNSRTNAKQKKKKICGGLLTQPRIQHIMPKQKQLRSSSRDVKRALEVLSVGLPPAAAKKLQLKTRRTRNRLLRNHERGEGGGDDGAPAPYTVFKRAARKHWVDHWIQQHPPSSPGGEPNKPPFEDYGSVMMPQVGALWQKAKETQDTAQPVFDPAMATWDDTV